VFGLANQGNNAFLVAVIGIFFNTGTATARVVCMEAILLLPGMYAIIYHHSILQNSGPKTIAEICNVHSSL
jgi:hypothetical protein